MRIAYSLLFPNAIDLFHESSQSFTLFLSSLRRPLPPEYPRIAGLVSFLCPGRTFAHSDLRLTSFQAAAISAEAPCDDLLQPGRSFSGLLRVNHPPCIRLRRWCQAPFPRASNRCLGSLFVGIRNRAIPSHEGSRRGEADGPRSWVQRL